MSACVGRHGSMNPGGRVRIGETSEQDLFHSRLDQIIDMKHALVKLARTVDWGFLEQTFGAVYTDKPGQPPCRDSGFVQPSKLICNQIALQWSKTGKFDYLSGPNHPAHSIALEFFTDDLRSRMMAFSSALSRASYTPSCCVADALAPADGAEKVKALLQESLAVRPGRTR